MLKTYSYVDMLPQYLDIVLTRGQSSMRCLFHIEWNRLYLRIDKIWSLT